MPRSRHSSSQEFYVVPSMISYYHLDSHEYQFGLNVTAFKARIVKLSFTTTWINLSVLGSASNANQLTFKSYVDVIRIDLNLENCYHFEGEGPHGKKLGEKFHQWIDVCIIRQLEYPNEMARYCFRYEVFLYSKLKQDC